MLGAWSESFTAYFYKFALVFITLSSTVSYSHAANYIINPTNTDVRFTVDRLKTTATTGGFYNVKGQLQYDPKVRTGNIALTIPISSLDTGNSILNNNLTGPDFFDARRYPLAQFTSTKWYFSINKDNPKVTKIDGTLTLHGVTKPITLTATTFNCSQNTIQKREVCSGQFTTTIDRTRWNINKYALFGLTKNLNLNISVEAVKQ